MMLFRMKFTSLGAVTGLGLTTLIYSLTDLGAARLTFPTALIILIYTAGDVSGRGAGLVAQGVHLPGRAAPADLPDLQRRPADLPHALQGGAHRHARGPTPAPPDERGR
jgi:hypothetical protein